jgi:hypothetical protein
MKLSILISVAVIMVIPITLFRMRMSAVVTMRMTVVTMRTSIIVLMVRMTVVRMRASAIIPLVVMAIVVNINRATLLGSVAAVFLRDGQHRSDP